MKIKNIILIIAMAIGSLTLSSCSTFDSFTKSDVTSFVLTTADVATGLYKLDAEIAQARVTINENKDKFSPEEWQQLVDAGKKIDKIRDNISGLIGNKTDVKQIIIHLSEFDYIVDDVTSIYNTVNTIAKAHKADFTPEQNAIIIQARTTIIKLHTAYQQLRVAADGSDATGTISKIMTVGTILAQIIKVIATFMV